MKKRITILGAGNMGHLLAAKFSRNNDVCVYLSEHGKNKHFSKKVKVLCEDTHSTYEGNVALVTRNIAEAIEFADLIFITYPAFLFEHYSKLLCPLLSSHHHLFFIPGSGGAELFFKQAIENGCTISGLQRVHSVARIINEGELVKESGIRRQLKVASIPTSFNNLAFSIVEELFEIPVQPLNNYLNVTLVNSNPLLHTSRLYSIFKNYPKSIKEYDRLPLFYENWNIKTSSLLNQMDRELFNLFDVLGDRGLPIDQILPLLKHYESTTDKDMAKKIRSIKSLKGLSTPSCLNANNKYVPDLNSRYFTADFPYGLDILISFCDFFNVSCKNMKKVSKWYHTISDTPLIFDIKDYFNSTKELIDYYL